MDFSGHMIEIDGRYCLLIHLFAKTSVYRGYRVKLILESFFREPSPLSAD